MTRGVTKPWLDILLHPSTRPTLVRIIDVLRTTPDVTPIFDDAFAFARFPLSQTHTVVVGQDPYPTCGDAHGLAFSSRAAACPRSIAVIFRALLESKLITEMPKSWDLTRWAHQGMVLFNTAFTTVVGQANAHAALWEPYTDGVFRLLAERLSDRPILWLAWGKQAQNKCRFVTAPHTLMEWCHPIAMVSPSFVHCTHFTEVTRRNPHFIWHLNPVDSEFYTDGSCIANGRPGARGSWGVYCGSGIFARREWGGALPAATPVQIDDAVVDQPPSNIRGEGVALIKALLIINDSGVAGRHTIYTDSQFWIDMLTRHIPTWIERKTPFTTKKNSDIVNQIWREYSRRVAGVNIVYTQAWHNYTPDPVTLPHWTGNKQAETVAKRFTPTK